MGWCHEFGPQITSGCGTAMVAGAAACSCPTCGVTCEGRFIGCEAVWAAGPKAVGTRRRDNIDATHRPAAPSRAVARLSSPLRSRSIPNAGASTATPGAPVAAVAPPGQEIDEEAAPAAGLDQVRPRSHNQPEPLATPADRIAPVTAVASELPYFLHTLARHLERVQALVRQLSDAHQELDSRLSLLAVHDEDRFDDAAGFATELMVIRTELSVIKTELASLRSALGKVQGGSNWLAPAETLAKLGETAPPAS